MDFPRLEAATAKYRTILGDQRVDFLLNLWKAQSEISVDMPWKPKDIENMQRTFGAGSPMLTADAPVIDRDQFVAALAVVAEALKNHPQVDPENVPAVLSADLSVVEQSDLEDAILDPRSVTERIAKRLGIDSESGLEIMFLSSMVYFAIQPFAIEAAAIIKEAVPSQELRASGTCPVCGAPAALGMIADAGEFTGGARQLWCSTCETVWGYPRVKCVRCGDTKPHRLHYYYDESDPGHRIHVCDTCGGSIPVVNEKLARMLEPRVEELAMLDLNAAVVGDESVRANFVEGSETPEA